MRYITLMLSMVVLTSACLAEETLREIKWSDPNLRGKLTAGEVIEPNADCPFAQLRVQNSQNEKKTFAILTINDPCITTASYALSGQVRYEGVEGTGYLEMWNHFPDGKMYFSRTLGDSGPMQSLTGSSGWRPFTLPFYIGDTSKMRPFKLVFNIVLPGRGTIFLGPIKLVQFEKGESAATIGAKNAWWTDRTGGWIGGITGSVIGTIWFHYRNLMLAGYCTQIMLLIARLDVYFRCNFAGDGFGCPYLFSTVCSLLSAVTYGYIVCVSMPPLSFYTGIKQRYEQIELRKMHAMDMR